MSGDEWSVLTPADNSETMLGLRRVLSNMVLKICEAHEERCDAYRYMERAKSFAEFLQAGNGIGAWACRGPYAGLSMVSGLLAETDTFFAAEYAEDFAELCWRAHAISAVCSPYHDDLECEGFRGTFNALEAKLRESGGR